MLLEANQIGKREQLADIIARGDAKNTPVGATIIKGERMKNMLFEWQLDSFEDVDDLSVLDGEDVSSFSNASADRARVGVYGMKIRDSAQVSDLADEISNVAGLSKGELAESIMKKLRRLARVREAFICGDQDTQAQSAGNKYRIRGLGSFINNTAQTTNPIPTAFLTPAASISGTATGSWVEATWQAVLQSIYTQTGEISDYVLACGPTLRRAVSNTLTKVSSSTNSSVQIRTYDTKFSGAIDNVVTVLNGDFGNISVLPTLWNAKGNVFSTNDESSFRGYLLRTDNIELHHGRMPRVKQLEDRGGGPRFLCDEVISLHVGSPLAHGKFNPTS